MKKILIILIAFISLNTFGQTTTGSAKTNNQTIVILNGTIHIGNGQKLENGNIIIKDGIIQNVFTGKPSTTDQNKIVIDATGKHIYPGFINVNNTLGITEIGAVRATRDFKETGSINPNVRTQAAFNTESRVIATVRTNGVLLSQVTPRGGLISGQSSVMKLDGWNWEDATILADDGIHLNWPKDFLQQGWWANGITFKENKNKKNQLQQLNKLFGDALAYSKMTKPQTTNLKLAAMSRLFTQNKNLYIHAESTAEIKESILFAKEKGVKNIVLIGCKNANEIAGFLAENSISVMLNRVHSLPKNEDSDVLQSYKNAQLLSDANVKYCLSWAGDMEAMNSRNLPFGAGTTVAYGVEYEKAVQSISLSAAQIVQIDTKYGSLEKGKSATLFISEGDALDMRTNNVVYALIDGKEINLTNPQKELAKKYSDKYGIQILNEK